MSYECKKESISHFTTWLIFGLAVEGKIHKILLNA
jgi:hypothetical protein